MQIDELRKLINKYNYEYYVLNTPTVRDSEYDKLYRRLLELETSSDEPIPNNSPTQRVGHPVLKGFKTKKHAKPMLSLGNVFNEEELREWLVKLNDSELEITCEPKLDGVAVSIVYVNGILDSATTRGDGMVGEDITAHVKAMMSVPLELSTSNPPSLLEVRGEIYMPIASFLQNNADRENSGKKLFANSRNATAGTLRSLDPSVSSHRGLVTAVYSMDTDLGQTSHSEGMELLNSLGFNICENYGTTETIEDCLSKCKIINAERSNLSYDIDGIVFKVNSLMKQSKLGTTNKIPKWAIAYKFPPDEKPSRLQDIFYQVGRTGQVTPVAKITPVHLSGVTVSKVNLHNFEEIRRLDLRYNDTLMVSRMGDVIPKVVGVDASNREDNAEPIELIDTCPECSGELEMRGTLAFCINTMDCPAQRERALLHWCSSRALDIKTLGPSMISALISRGLLYSPVDFYKLTMEDLLSLDGVLEKTANRILEAISVSKSTTLQRFIYGLGIDHVGSNTSSILEKNFTSLEALSNASIEDLSSIPDIGSKTAKSVYGFINSVRGTKLISDLIEEGLHWPEEEQSTTNLPLDGSTYVFTGSLEVIPRKEAEVKLKELGAKVSKSVSSNTTSLIVGNNPGSSLTKAEALGVKVISEEDVLALLKL